MADVNITGSLLDALGSAYDFRRAKLWIVFNTETGWIIDEAGNVRMGAGSATVNADGTFELTGVPIPGTSNPTSFQIKIRYEVPAKLGPTRGVEVESGDFGWFTVSEAADLQDLVEEQYVPPTWMSNAIDTLQGYVDQAQAAQAQATDARDAAIAAGLNWRGPWSAPTAYAVADAVSYGGASYRRLVAGTTATPPDADGTNWGVLAAKGDTGPAGGPIPPGGSPGDVPTPASGGGYEWLNLSASYGYELKSTLTDATFDTFLAGLPAGARVFVPATTTLTLNAAHTITQPVVIDGPGKIVDGRSNPSSALFTIGPAASGSRILCHLAGSVSGQYKANHHAVAIMGTDNGAATPPTYVTDVVVKPASISGFGSVGIYGEFVKDSVVEVDVIHDMGYGGVLLLSAVHVDATIHHLRDLTPGTSGNVYALQFTRRGASSDLVRYPHSSDCNGWVGEMHGVSIWDGLGTHGGQNITLGWGSMYGVKKPFDVTAATDAAGEQAYAPNNVTINMGSADSGVTDGTMGPAGTINGAFKTTDVIGTPTEYAKGIVVNPGSLKGYGIQGGANDGAIYCYATQGLIAALGSCVEPSPFAVNMYHDNKDFFVSVVATDAWTTDGSEAGAVHCSSDYNNGVVEFSGITRGSKTATIVNNRGLSVKNVASNAVRLGTACNFSAATTPLIGPINVWLDAAVKLGAQMRALAGTAGAPSYTFDGDPASGIYQAATNEVSVATAATLRARFLTTALLLSDGYNISVGSTNGTKFGTASTQKLSFWGATCIARPSAYTQTYSTATRTHSNPTATTVATTAATNTTPYGFTTQEQADALVTAVNALVADMANIKQFANSICDDLQSVGLLA
ncbi:hypothetical protein [Nocardioides aquiterrae]|uniref:Uncharacterized protein n=1 Tax=Nocardioides aquiterrae TaxID=203799 RepID=A0ABN1UE76_9ACTN